VTSMLYKKIEDPGMLFNHLSSINGSTRGLTDRLQLAKPAAQLESIVSSSSKARSIEVYRATKFIQLASVAKWADRFAGKAEIVAVSPGRSFYLPTRRI
jgi:hypothetical protein